jgi:hypothetical protein
MSNFAKPLHELSEKEIQEGINHWSPQYGALAMYELQRRLQKDNAHEIALLTREIKKLKDIVAENAETTRKAGKNSNNLALLAIFIASASFITQVIFSMDSKSFCYEEKPLEGKPGFFELSDCVSEVHFGYFGWRSFKNSNHIENRNPL